jgi:hypothetical protein
MRSNEDFGIMTSEFFAVEGESALISMIAFIFPLSEAIASSIRSAAVVSLTLPTALPVKSTSVVTVVDIVVVEPLVVAVVSEALFEEVPPPSPPVAVRCRR